MRVKLQDGIVAASEQHAQHVVPNVTRKESGRLVSHRAADLCRPRVMPNTADWQHFIAEFVSSILGRLRAFERMLVAQSGPYFGGNEPVAADYFVFEAVDAWRELLGAPLVAALARCPRLRDQDKALSSR